MRECTCGAFEDFPYTKFYIFSAVFLVVCMGIDLYSTYLAFSKDPSLREMDNTVLGHLIATHGPTGVIYFIPRLIAAYLGFSILGGALLYFWVFRFFPDQILESPWFLIALSMQLIALMNLAAGISNFITIFLL